MTPVNSSQNLSISVDVSNDDIDVNNSPADEVEELRDIVKPYREMYEAEVGQQHKYHKGLGGIWTPGLIKTCRAKGYFKKAKGEGFSYSGPELFLNRINATETLFGGMAYHVDREVVLSLGGRLSEIGAQKISLANSEQASIDMVLQEVPKEKPVEEDGEQVVVFSANGQDDVKIDYRQLEAALVKTIGIQDAVKVDKSEPDKNGKQRIVVDFKMPKTISWDGDTHHIHLEFTVKLPKNGRRNFDTFLISLLGLSNGRPAQHYQNEAGAVIHLQELIFGKKNDLSLVIDPESSKELRAKPDLFLGKSLALLLTQTAGGLFEKDFYQEFAESKVNLYQRTPDGGVVDLGFDVAEEIDDQGRVVRVSDLSYQAAPYRVKYTEEKILTGFHRVGYELREIQFLTGDGQEELMAILFNSGGGRGIRDLGFEASVQQKGRFQFRVNGMDGFGFGDFIVSETQKIKEDQSGQPIYYTSIEMVPRHSKDLKNKKIILHVVHSQDGLYTETQIVPVKLVHPPKFEIKRI